MFVRLFLKSDGRQYTYEDVNMFDIGIHKFPSGRTRKCLTFVLDNGNTINFPLSEIRDICAENFKDERHPWNDDAKIIFVKDGQAYEKR